MAEKESYVEIEIKLRYSAGADQALRMLEQHGFRETAARTLEADQLFDRATSELLNAGQVLRLRLSGGRATVTFKGQATRERHKSREEIEFDVSDAANFARTLDRLGYEPRFRYEKFRTKFARANEAGFVTLDETPFGVFLELEGPANWIDQTAEQLGFSHAGYLTSSYASLYRDYRKSHPGAPENMVFQNDGSPERSSLNESSNR